MNLNIPFRPRLFETLKGYSSKDFVPDLVAGLTVGIVAPVRQVDPNHEEKKRLEAVRIELTNALDRVNDVLKSPDRNGIGFGLSSAAKNGKIPVPTN